MSQSNLTIPTTDLAQHIGRELARTDIAPARYAMLRRIQSHMTHDAQRRCEAAQQAVMVTP